MKIYFFTFICTLVFFSSCSDRVANTPLDASPNDAALITETIIDVPTGDLDPTKITWGNVEAVPIEIVDGLPLISGTIEGIGPKYFVLDTLSQVIFVDEDIVNTTEYTEVNLVVGEKDLGLHTVKGRDMSPDEIFLGLDIAGLIGQAYFVNRFTTIDYINSRAFLHEQEPDLDTALPGFENEPRQEINYEIPNLMSVVTPTIGNAGAVRLLFDTSSRVSIVYRRVFDAIDDGTLPRLDGYHFTTKYGEEYGFVTRIPTISFANLIVNDIVAVVIPDDNHLKNLLSPQGVEVEGYLGAQFWQRFAISIDGELVPDTNYKKLYLWGDGKSTEVADPWTKVGVELALHDSEVTVEMVYKGTSAETSGVEVGDILENKTDLLTARQHMQGTAGETRVLQIKNKGQITVTVENLLP